MALKIFADDDGRGRIGNILVEKTVIVSISWKVEVEGIISSGCELWCKVLKSVGKVVENGGLIELNGDFVEKRVDIIAPFTDIVFDDGRHGFTEVVEVGTIKFENRDIRIVFGVSEVEKGRQEFDLDKLKIGDIGIESWESESEISRLRKY